VSFNPRIWDQCEDDILFDSLVTLRLPSDYIPLMQIPHPFHPLFDPHGDSERHGQEVNREAAPLPTDLQVLVIPNHVTEAAGKSGEGSPSRKVPDFIMSLI
jgi:hypothetical protein